MSANGKARVVHVTRKHLSGKKKEYIMYAALNFNHKVQVEAQERKSNKVAVYVLSAFQSCVCLATLHTFLIFTNVLIQSQMLKGLKLIFF